MFVGVGAARVRDLFQKAKRNAPAILFIDELDAIGRQRGTGLGGSHDEREQTLNQILVEMDGFETDTRVIVMAATNRPDVLDPALLRPGRFDRRVVIDLPDMLERKDILRIHTRNKPIAKDANMEQIARSTAGLSGADLRNVVNEAAILAARENLKSIHQAQLTSAIEKVLLGPERRSHLMSGKEKEISAYHESGHAIIGKTLPNCDKVQKVSVVSRGMALGYTWSMPSEDRRLYSKAKFEDEIAQLLGGWVSEKIIYGEVTTGAQSDLKRASKIARGMVTAYGMSDLIGPIVFGEREEAVFLGRDFSGDRNYSEAKAAQIDQEINRIIEQAREKATKILTEKKALLNKLSEKLVKEETVEGEELDKLLSS
jgi:cell division protease FtsH